MDKIHSPISWYGGKGMMTAKILPLLPPHKIYVEPFGGGASILFSKPPSPIEVYNDLNAGLVNFFRVLRDPDKAARLHMLAASTPFSRQEYLEARDQWAEGPDDVRRAYRWFVAARMAFSGNFGTGWSRALGSSSRGMSQCASRWISATDVLGWAHARLMRVQVERLDFRRVIADYDTPETLFYLDPPYVLETRRCEAYEHELKDDDHRDLVELLLKAQGKALLSGYDHEIYRPLEKAGWRCVRFDVPCNTVRRGGHTGVIGKGGLRDHRRTEVIWISPRAQVKSPRRVSPKFVPQVHAYFVPSLAAGVAA